MRGFLRQPRITLGHYRSWFFKRTLQLSRQLACCHMHILGKTGSGKSYFLAGLFLSLHEAGLPVTLIDPHGDLAELVLAHLVASGAYDDPTQYERLIYLDLPTAANDG